MTEVKKDFSKMKIALAHDYLVSQGGAERVLKVLSDMFPEAPIYTMLYDDEKFSKEFKGRTIVTSYLQKFPLFLRKRYWALLPFYPVIPETFDFRDYDVVISSTGAWMKGIVTKLNTKHVCYVHSPMRFVWDYNERYLKETGRNKISLMVRFFFNYLRVWDKLASERPEFLIANSNYTKQRISKYYRRESTVIYPPVGMEHGTWNKEQAEKMLHDKCSMICEEGYFLIASRLTPNKKVDVAVEAFNKLGLPLVIVGEGKQEKQLRAIAKENIHFMGRVDDAVVQRCYAQARAFVFPAEDDFGMTAVEAMSHGTPVIALRAGGVLESVIEGKTGEFFDAPTPEVLADGVRRFMLKEKSYDKDKIKKRAQEFSRERFEKELKEFMEKVL